jgi:hypothetical protein
LQGPSAGILIDRKLPLERVASSFVGRFWGRPQVNRNECEMKNIITIAAITTSLLGAASIALAQGGTNSRTGSEQNRGSGQSGGVYQGGNATGSGSMSGSGSTGRADNPGNAAVGRGDTGSGSSSGGATLGQGQSR